MLVHICCSVDSHFFLEKLQHDYPDEKLTGFFYDPNIHPYSEYRLRYLDVQRSCKKLGIDLLEGEYDFETWMDAVRGLEKEPEKGARCEVCFDRRFEVSANKALELGEKRMTTTLLVSPLKSQEQLKRVGDAFHKEHGVEFIAVDYRAAGGTQDQSRVTKEQQLYRQDYCGCLFGLSMQREHQDRLMDEMFSPVDGRILPASIEERLTMYEQRMALEDAGKTYRIVKQKFLNYRQFTCRLTRGKSESVPAYALHYSTLPRKRANGKIEYEQHGIHYFNRDDIRFISIDEFNKRVATSYASVTELIFNPPAFEDELALRRQLCETPFDLTPVIVTDEKPEGKYTLFLDAKVYEDTKERLIID
ncbi:epoxyqueuosine reductase QueH [Sulfurimonas sp. HSL-3221]|uniref:epoxyqueuosine reductase QueH n=1 Tax=Thiomicrolovo sulfuroxydans TaxID=2894755 RepID=UPI001E284B60|nr:epoxyqueuosine reductase QueH [Sulfurimonas sp. HSL-3221]UFS61899.1 epoxyqueuosine reductase QueH [Sulfurimonas sp. HSL-3221]